jgi:hypothetical protein
VQNGLFKETMVMPFIGGTEFDEYAGKVLVISIQKPYQAFALEVQYDLTTLKYFTSNIYWNDGVINRITILNDFLIISGEATHQIMLHSQKKQTYIQGSYYYPDLAEEESSLSNINTYFSFGK